MYSICFSWFTWGKQRWDVNAKFCDINLTYISVLKDVGTGIQIQLFFEDMIEVWLSICDIELIKLNWHNSRTMHSYLENLLLTNKNHGSNILKTLVKTFLYWYHLKMLLQEWVVTKSIKSCHNITIVDSSSCWCSYLSCDYCCDCMCLHCNIITVKDLLFQLFNRFFRMNKSAMMKLAVWLLLCRIWQASLINWRNKRINFIFLQPKSCLRGILCLFVLFAGLYKSICPKDIWVSSLIDYSKLFTCWDVF